LVVFLWLFKPSNGISVAISIGRFCGVKKARIVVADDHAITLAGLRMLIEANSDFALVAAAKSGPEALAAVLDLKPDVAVLDVSLPEIDGIALARRLARECPSVGVIVLTAHEDRRYLTEALHAGARGFVLKSSATECLVRAIRGVLVGGLYIDPAIAGNLFERPRRSARRRETGEAPLTDREADVLKLVALGLTSKQIAFRLDVGAKSVETYKARALVKIGGKTRADIVRYASAKGWLGKI
jgi:DNA-binding NarL/FixJ family response regulator